MIKIHGLPRSQATVLLTARFILHFSVVNVHIFQSRLGYEKLGSNAPSRLEIEHALCKRLES
jgi:hypothetical protein